MICIKNHDNGYIPTQMVRPHHQLVRRTSSKYGEDLTQLTFPLGWSDLITPVVRSNHWSGKIESLEWKDRVTGVERLKLQGKVSIPTNRNNNFIKAATSSKQSDVAFSNGKPSPKVFLFGFFSLSAIRKKKRYYLCSKEQKKEHVSRSN